MYCTWRPNTAARHAGGSRSIPYRRFRRLRLLSPIRPLPRSAADSRRRCIGLLKKSDLCSRSESSLTTSIASTIVAGTRGSRSPVVSGPRKAQNKIKILNKRRERTKTRFFGVDFRVTATVQSIGKTERVRTTQV